MSLIRLTAKFAPQFRVACRGTLLPDIAFLIIFAGLLDKCILWVKNKSWFPGRIRDYSLLIIGFIVLLTAVVDAKPYMSFALPNPLVQTTMLDKHDKPYELLAPLPYARLVELPFYCEPCGDAPEYDYPYMLRRMLHHKPILNYLRDPQYDAPIKKMAQSLNGFSPEAWRLMYRLGVRYVTINKIEMARKEPKRSFESFPLPAQTIFESDELKILRLTGDVEKSQIPSAEQSLDSILRF